MVGKITVFMIATSADLRKRIEEIMKTVILTGWSRQWRCRT
jgi:hypothetical protein